MIRSFRKGQGVGARGERSATATRAQLKGPPQQGGGDSRRGLRFGRRSLDAEQGCGSSRSVGAGRRCGPSTQGLRRQRGRSRGRRWSRPRTAQAVGGGAAAGLADSSRPATAPGRRGRRRQVVGRGDDDPAFAHQGPDRGLDGRAVGGIQQGQGFVQQAQRRLLNEQAGDQDQLLLAAGQAVEGAVGKMADSSRSSAARAASRSAGVRAEDQRRRCDPAQRRQMQGGEARADRARRRQPGDGAARSPARAAAPAGPRGLQQRGLARAVGTDHGDDLARGDALIERQADGSRARPATSPSSSRLMTASRRRRTAAGRPGRRWRRTAGRPAFPPGRRPWPAGR
jgi:hypothetical protein